MMDVLNAAARAAQPPTLARRRVVVTGLGAVTPVGNTAPDTWKTLVAGRSGVAEATQLDTSAYPTHCAAEVKGFDPEAFIPAKEARRMARCSQLAIVAGREAVVDSGVDIAHEDRERMGVILGVAFGGIDVIMEPLRKYVLEGNVRVTPHVPLESLINMPAFHVGMEHGFQGPLSTIGTACAAGTQAIGDALEWIRRGTCDVVLAGGTESQISPFFFVGFTALHVLSTYKGDPAKAARPFDLNRDGFVIGEGSVVLVLEELNHALRRGAHIYAEVLGQSATADAFHIAAPDPAGTGPARTMRWALADAGITPEQVDYINAHGSGTQPNDSAETAAIKQVFGDHAYRLTVSSTKSMVGHLFGAAGAIEGLAAVMAVCSDVIHPTINYDTPDPLCDLDYAPNVARHRPVNVALSNSFGLGGQNACAVFGKWTNNV
jgi:3-oxoacyl-[acyl-carrier-protein] synthase II